MPDELSPGLGSADGLTAEERACIPEALIEQKMLSFRGRIGRAVFWGRLFAALICVAFAATSTSMIVYLIPGLGGNGGMEMPAGLGILLALVGFAAFLLGLGLLVLGTWLSLATHVKRWHDLDFSGWMLLLNIIPYVGLLILIWEGCFRGTDGRNRFGPNPIQPEHGRPSS
ncbi:MAG: DUF805 domain-containing protein [Terracidiphilus sp.]